MDGPYLFRMAITLALLLAIPGLLLWLVRRFGWTLPGQPAEGARLRVVARTALDTKHVLLLIRRDAQEQLLLLGPTGPTVIESAITLTRRDLAEQRRQAREQAARAAAAAATLDQAQQRLRHVSSRLGAGIRFLRSRIRDAAAPSFARLVERSPRHKAPRPGVLETQAAPVGRPRRSRKGATCR